LVRGKQAEANQQPHSLPAAFWQLDCREAATGKLRWGAKLRIRPVWAGFQGQTVLAAGPGGVLSLSLLTGKPLWEFTTPAYPLVNKPYPSDNHLSAFRQTSTRLFFLQGERRLFALDANCGRVLWSHWAPAAQIRPEYPGGRFHSLYHAGEDWLVLQTGGGKRQILESDSGRLRYYSSRTENRWLQAPVAFGERRICLAPDAGQILMFDPATGKNLWTHSTNPTPGSTFGTGEMPGVFGQGGTLLVLLPRNIGYHFERLDPETGAPVWQPGLRVVREVPQPDQVTIGTSAFVYLNRQVLQARSLADGKLLWSRALAGPGPSWRAVCAGETVLAFPSRIKPWMRWSGFPTFGIMPSLPCNVWAGEGLSILCCEARDGQLLQRLNFSGPFSEPTVRIQSHRLLVGGEGQAWILKDSSKRAGNP
jgi:hypothetical protein